MSWNVDYDHIFPAVDATRAAKFVRVFNAVSPDVLCLQEIYNHSQSQLKTLMDSVQPLGTPDGWYVYVDTNGGNAIVSKYSLSLQQDNPVVHGSGNCGMALIDLPNAQFSQDLYMMNVHYKCCNGFDTQRQSSSDGMVNWMRDARTAGGSITLPTGTPMIVMGDLNLVQSPQPLTTLLDGNVQDNVTFGADSAPDWDGSNNSVLTPFHNVTGSDTYTWRNDGSSFAPSRLDFITYTDSVLNSTHSFILNTTTMTAGDLTATGLQLLDSCFDNIGSEFDHLPLVADFTVVPEPQSWLLFGAGLLLLRRSARRFRASAA